MRLSLYALRPNRTSIAFLLLRSDLNRGTVKSMSIAAFKNGEVNRGGRPKLPASHVRPANLHTTKDSLVGAVMVRKGQAGVEFTYKDGRTCKHPDGEFHDCAYVNARNRLIPAAELRAARMVTSDDPTGMKRARAFCDAMTELAREKGLIK